ncbi:MAG: hypothetical protein FWD62_01535 [Betaproteobacteria bacterium]|nr:hypothetical protein [Betaproteobacteria bacterium]
MIETSHVLAGFGGGFAAADLTVLPTLQRKGQGFFRKGADVFKNDEDTPGAQHSEAVSDGFFPLRLIEVMVALNGADDVESIIGVLQAL